MTPTYECYWVHDKALRTEIRADTSWEARKQFRDFYNASQDADVPVHECVAVRIWATVLP
ncbi:hypothetical protein [Bradyrhizobium sp. LTSP885]|uniref:hypothetical protein n=1 Tax=Bradyrhizobium sp. LTSP885 TaxID=1619232 RepID=UPI000AADC5C4|nr:hypothetical protein [Bradyrhizobium sp. LTSP885]